jgi:hypothetical protein
VAGGEGVEGAEAGGELDGGEAAFAIKGAEKIGGRLIALLRIAFETAGDEVAIKIATAEGLREDVVEAASVRLEGTQAVEATVAVACVNGGAERRGGEEIEFLDIAKLRGAAPVEDGRSRGRAQVRETRTSRGIRPDTHRRRCTLEEREVRPLRVSKSADAPVGMTHEA